MAKEQIVHEYLLPALTQLLKGAKVKWMAKNSLTVTNVGYDSKIGSFYVDTTCPETGHEDRITLSSFAGSKLLDDLNYEIIGGAADRDNAQTRSSVIVNAQAFEPSQHKNAEPAALDFQAAQDVKKKQERKEIVGKICHLADHLL